LVTIFVLSCLSTTVKCLEPHINYLQYLRQRWTVSNGFPGGRINTITQTDDGYLWIGTSKGLVRFDGFAFTRVGNSNRGTEAVSQALALVPTKDGALWVWDQHMDVRRYIHGKFDDIASLNGNEGGVAAISRSNQNDLLVATQTPRLFRYSNGGREELTKTGNLGIPSPQTVVQTSDGKIWMATFEAGLFSWDQGRVVAVKDGVPDKINCLLPVGNGGLWIGTDEGVVFWDGHEISSRNSPQALKGIRVLSLAQDRDKNLWIGTSGGLFRMNSDGLSLMEDAQQGPGRTITAIFEDREGNLWVGDAQGVERLRDGLLTTFSIGERSASGDASAGPIYADSMNRVWVADSHGGLSCVQRGKATQITAAALGRDEIYSIAGFDDDLWVGRREGGLTHLKQTGSSKPAATVVRTYTHSEGLAQNSVSSVFRASDGTIWAGTLSGGVSSLSHGRFSTMTSANGLGSNTISSIQEDRDGAMWFGTSDGLSRFANGKMKTFRAREGLPSAEITTLMIDSSGVLWVGTSEGLAFYSLGRLHPVLDARPALHEPIFGIAEDKDGHLWLTSSNHVFCVYRSALIKDVINDTDYQEFGESDGLRGTEGVRRDRSAVTDPGGRVWLSTFGGLSLVRKNSHTAAPAPPHVESMLSDGKWLDPYEPIKIKPDPQRIAIAYDAVSLAVPNRVRYRYKLQGFDHAWSEPTESRQVVYTNLGPGSYQFRLETNQGEDGWKGSVNILSFDIQPNIWQTAWFRLLLSTAVCALLFLFYRIRVRFIARAISARFDERLDERTRMARELHDTFLQTVQGSKLVADDALAEDTDAAKMRSAMEKLSGWLGQAVAEGRAALQALRTTTTEQNELAKFLDRSAKEYSKRTSISVTLTVIGDAVDLHPIMRDEIARIAEEAIRNACLHSHASQLSIVLRYARDLNLAIKDNGIGMNPEVAGVGKTDHFGIQGMKERSARIRAKLTITSTPNAGTQITLNVPGDAVYRREKWSILKKLQMLNLWPKPAAESDPTANRTDHNDRE
jgi:ligand-binding sensor domain-containing protein